MYPIVSDQLIVSKKILLPCQIVNINKHYLDPNIIAGLEVRG